MKNLVFNSAIALVVIAYVVNVSFDTRKEVKVSKVIPVTSQTNHAKNLPVVMYSNKFDQKDAFSTEYMLSTMEKKSQNAKNDLAVTSIRIEKVSSDVNQISGKYLVKEVQMSSSESIENMFSISSGKTIDQVIADDNAITGNDFSGEIKALDMFAIENQLPFRVGKSIEEVIAEDNAIIGNEFSNEIQALDFDSINGKLAFDVTIDNIPYNNSGKTIEEIIAEDNEITGNNFSNETRALASSMD